MPAQNYVNYLRYRATRLEDFYNRCHTPDTGEFCSGGFFHGSDEKFEVGDILLPQSKTGNVKFLYADKKKADNVYLTDSDEAASYYGKYVYEVEPLGTVKPDPDEEDAFIAPTARVIRRIETKGVSASAEEFANPPITEFYNSCHGEDGRFCETHGVTHAIQKASPSDLAATKAQVAQKIVDAPVPSKASVKRARALANVSLGSQNSADRRRQRENLFNEFGGKERGYVIDAATGIKMHWTQDSELNPNGYPLFERGRIFTERQGGGYQLPNLIPELYDTNRARGDRPIRKENT